MGAKVGQDIFTFLRSRFKKLYVLLSNMRGNDPTPCAGSKMMNFMAAIDYFAFSTA